MELQRSGQERQNYPSGRHVPLNVCSSDVMPADRGRHAYCFLASCFVLEALVWGFPYAFGVFNLYYTRHAQFSRDASQVPNIGTTATGMMYFGAPFVAIAMQRWPRYRRATMVSGLIFMIGALVAASFCDTVGGLIACQGAVYAVGALMLYFPAMQLIGEWFVNKRGLAFGLMWTGTGFSGVVTPFLLQWLLDRYGFRTTLRTWAVVVLVLGTPCIWCVRPRFPVPSTSILRPIDMAFLRSGGFWYFAAGNIVQSLGSSLPTLFIPTFADAMGFPNRSAPLTLALYHVAFCLGAILLGMLVDRRPLWTVIGICTIGQSISIFVFWGLTSTEAMLYIFALAFGAFGGAFPATWTGCAKALQSDGKHGNADTGLIVALMAAGKGIGATISGPLSNALLKSGSLGPESALAYATPFGTMIVFTGISAVLGGLTCIGQNLV